LLAIMFSGIATPIEAEFKGSVETGGAANDSSAGRALADTTRLGRTLPCGGRAYPSPPGTRFVLNRSAAAPLRRVRSPGPGGRGHTLPSDRGRAIRRSYWIRRPT
jgi:hypothetical protein